jgi:hypothetical protein
MYDVVERLFKCFGDTPGGLTELVNKNVSPASAGKLSILFEDNKTKCYAQTAGLSFPLLLQDCMP